ncbi:MAG: protein kinase, partial [Myxococcota bacterium]
MHRTIGPYSIKQELSRGGMGVVYQVHDQNVGQELALKLLLHPDSAFLRAQFEREYQTLLELKHPSIIEVFDFGVVEGCPYYTMELMDGADLSTLSPLPYRVACTHLCALAESLSLLHARKLVHRDISPQNVRITSSGRCKLLDFGAVAHWGPSEKIIGQPSVIAPESFYGTPLDPLVDIYGLGALAYWMLTGQHAYPARVIAQLPQYWNTPLQPPSAHVRNIPAEVDRLVIDMLSLDPKARPAHIREVLTQLHKILGSERKQTRTLGQSALASIPFTGQVRLLEAFDASLQRCQQGQGNTLWVEGSKGSGKTTLLNAFTRIAQRQGVMVFRFHAELIQKPLQMIEYLVHNLLVTLPAQAKQTVMPYRETLSALSPKLNEILEMPIQVAREPMELFQHKLFWSKTLCDWLRDLCQQVPLVLLVDDASRMPDSICQFLCTLGLTQKNHPLLLVLTWSREQPSLKIARKLKKEAHLLPLSRLSCAELELITSSLFSETPGSKMLAHWLYEHTQGCPAQLKRTLDTLMQKEFISYVDGSWIIPFTLPELERLELPVCEGLPIEQLNSSAQKLLHYLTLQSPLPWDILDHLSLCQPHIVVQELLFRGLAQSTAEGLQSFSNRLCQPCLPPLEERASLHEHIAQAYLHVTSLPMRQKLFCAGHHFLRAKQQSKAASVLFEACTYAIREEDYFELEAYAEDIAQAVRYSVKQGYSLVQLAPALTLLATAGYQVHWKYIPEFASLVVKAFEQLMGLDTVRKLRPYLGKALSLACGLCWGRVRLWFSAKPSESLHLCRQKLASSILNLSGGAATMLDYELGAKILTALEPFSMLPARSSAASIY